MNKTNELRTTTALVKSILLEDKQARNSDSFLYFKVLKKISIEKNIDIDSMPVTTFLLHMRDCHFPAFETVRRTRQKLQAEFPELSGNKKVQEYREANETTFREYARGGVINDQKRMDFLT